MRITRKRIDRMIARINVMRGKPTKVWELRTGADGTMDWWSIPGVLVLDTMRPDPSRPMGQNGNGYRLKEITNERGGERDYGPRVRMSGREIMLVLEGIVEPLEEAGKCRL